MMIPNGVLGCEGTGNGKDDGEAEDGDFASTVVDNRRDNVDYRHLLLQETHRWHWVLAIPVSRRGAPVNDVR